MLCRGRTSHAYLDDNEDFNVAAEVMSCTSLVIITQILPDVLPDIFCIFAGVRYTTSPPTHCELLCSFDNFEIYLQPRQKYHKPLDSTVAFAASSYSTVATFITHHEHTWSSGVHQPAAVKPPCILYVSCVEVTLLQDTITLVVHNGAAVAK